MTDGSAALLARLASETGMAAARTIVAIERLADRAAVPGLREFLARAPDDLAWDVGHALTRLTGWEPVIPLGDRASQAEAIRRAWESYDEGAPRAPRLEIDGERFVLRDARGLLGIDYDEAPPGSTWPRWGRSLFVAGAPMYRLQSSCGTCETWLHLTGWPAPNEASDDVRAALANVDAISPALFETLLPLLSILRTGHYVARLVDLDLERADSAERSWFTRRGPHRKDGDEEEEPIEDWPGASHYQLRDLVPGAMPTFGVVMPSQPLEGLREEAVARHDEALARGARPTAVAFAWLESRYVRARFDERFLVSVILDGHHKIEAAVRRRQLARVLLLCRIEDTWGPAGDRAAWFLETTAPFRA